MVSKLLRRLVGASASTSGDDGTQARKRSATELPSSWVRLHVWWRDQGRCVLCGEREGVWFDHIIPVREGGSNTEHNIRLMCERCKRGEKGALIRRRKRLGA
jgi:5-methylcytosine-specific restriction endonuclease McrA